MTLLLPSSFKATNGRNVCAPSLVYDNHIIDKCLGLDYSFKCSMPNWEITNEKIHPNSTKYRISIHNDATLFYFTYSW